MRKQRRCKPGYVRREPCLSFIFTAGCPARYSSLPPGNGRAALDCRYIWPCNPQDVRRRRSPGIPVGSYPAFSPLPGPLPVPAVVFCHIIPDIAAGFPVKKCGALCCPDFPLRPFGRSDRPRLCQRLAPLMMQNYCFVSDYTNYLGLISLVEASTLFIAALRRPTDTKPLAANRMSMMPEMMAVVQLLSPTLL